jgi:PmbA protein
MMRQTILNAIEAYNASSELKIADWTLVGTVTTREEHYFVREKTEEARLVDETLFSLTLYVDAEVEGKKVRGEATVSIQPSLTREEVAEKVKIAAYAASKSRNAWFELPGKAEAKVTVPVSGFEALAPARPASAARAALYAPESEPAVRAGSDKPAGSINCLELFLSRTERTFLNSKGQAFDAVKWRGYSEFVVDAQSASGPVELFDDIEFSEPDKARLEEATRPLLIEVRDRAVAKPLPNISSLPVILSGKEAEQVFSWFFWNSTTQAVFTKSSPFKLGMNIQQSEEGGAVADPFDMWAEPALPGFPASSAYDHEGFPLERVKIVEKGVLKTLVGSIRYAQWLCQPQKGSFNLFSVSPGSMSVSEMRAKPHLEPVMFSDFRLDPVTGDFGAEMRLAYWFDGKKRIPVTGGSISGAASTFRSTMRLSSECAPATQSVCPVAVLLTGIAIAGG